MFIGEHPVNRLREHIHVSRIDEGFRVSQKDVNVVIKNVQWVMTLDPSHD
jgi:hypothetical protein